MKKYYDCDGGTIMIGNENSRACFPNGYGDGCFSVRVIDTEEQKKKFNEDYKKWNYLGSVEGNEINVYAYDCLRDEDLKNKENILFTLSGRYGVYYNNGKIALEKRG